VSGKWWLLRAGGAGEPGEAAEGHGAAGKVHLSRTRQKKWAKVGPLSPFSSCPRISQSGQGARAALWAALWPDSGRPSAGPGRPFGPPLVLRGGLAALWAALRAAPFSKGGPSGGPFSVRAALILRVAALLPHGRPPRPPWAAHRPSGGHIRAALNLRVAALRAARPPRRGGIGPPDFRGWPPTFGWRAARFWSEGRPIWRLGGPGGGRAARSPLTADSTTYRTPVPRCSLSYISRYRHFQCIF